MTRLLTESAIIALVFIAGSGLIDALEHPDHFHIGKVNQTFAMEPKKFQVPVQATEPAKTPTETKPLANLQVNMAADNDDNDPHIYRSRYKVLWLVFGALGGAWCYFAYNLVKSQNFVVTLSRLKTTCYITLAFITSIFVVPQTLMYFKMPTHEEACGFAGFSGSVSAWGMMEILTFCLIRLGFAARTQGIAGVVSEIKGGGAGNGTQNTTGT